MRPAYSARLSLGILTTFQLLAAIAITAGDIGFDHPGRFGLSFHHFVAAAMVLVVAGAI